MKGAGPAEKFGPGLKIPLGANAAHLCVDMQRLFSSAGPWALSWMEPGLPSGQARRAGAADDLHPFPHAPIGGRHAGSVAAYYRKWSSVTRERLDSRLLDLMPELERHAPPASVIDKFVYSAFASSKSSTFLRRGSIDTLIVSGSETDVCVLSSILAAIDHGYRIVMARDAVCSSSDASHDAIIDLFHRRFDVQVDVAEVAEILETWRPG